VAGAVSIIADALRLSGDLDGALKTIEEARSSLEKYNTTDEAQRVILLSAVLFRQGLILGADGQVSLMRSDEAIAALQRAFDLVEDAAAKDPSDARSRILFVQDGRELGNILRHQNPQHALAVFDHAIQRVREVKGNTKARRGEAQLLAASSYPLRQLNRIAESRQRIDQAFELLKEVKVYPANLIHTDDEAETLLRALAAHLADAGDFRRAIETYRELLDKLLASHPDPENDLFDATVLSSLYQQVRRLYLDSGESEKAKTMSATRLKLWQDWNRKLPNSFFIQRELAAASAS
jgi:tetratricopeptide (TPR) repeat protein